MTATNSSSILEAVEEVLSDFSNTDAISTTIEVKRGGLLHAAFLHARTLERLILGGGGVLTNGDRLFHLVLACINCGTRAAGLSTKFCPQCVNELAAAAEFKRGAPKEERRQGGDLAPHPGSSKRFGKADRHQQRPS